MPPTKGVALLLLHFSCTQTCCVHAHYEAWCWVQLQSNTSLHIVPAKQSAATVQVLACLSGRVWIANMETHFVQFLFEGKVGDEAPSAVIQILSTLLQLVQFSATTMAQGQVRCLIKLSAIELSCHSHL